MTVSQAEVPAREAAEQSDRRPYRFEIFAICFASLLIEISYTRIISFKLFYYYTYLVIGLALLGIGTGGVIVAVSRRLERRTTHQIMTWGCLLGALSVGVGYAVIARVPIDTLAIWDYGTWTSFRNLVGLVVISFALFASFVAVGVMISTLFGRRSDQIGRLYFADLVGAGLACAVVVTLISTIGPPSTVALAGMVLALVGLRLAWKADKAAQLGTIVMTVLLGIVVVAPGVMPTIRTDGVKVQVDESNTLHSAWSPVFRVDAVQVNDDTRVLFHDGLLGSAIHRFDGDVSTLDRFDADPRSFPFETADEAPGNVMIIGAAGGNEILASLYFDSGHIDAIELNPVTHSLVTDEFADFAGHIADRPDVNYIRGDGRTFLARSDDTYDLVWFPAPDSYSATNAATAGAFVLSESYLYTQETIEESFDHLGGDGILAVQYGEFDYETKPNRTTRYVATARQALEDRGVDDPTGHILVATTPAEGVGGVLSTILVREEPFTTDQVDRFIEALDDVEGAALRYAPGQPLEDDPVSDLVTAPDDEVDDFLAEYPFAVGPITDDGPFFWHFTPFGDVIRDLPDPIDPGDFEIDIGERVLLLLLLVATVFAAVFLLLPFVAIRDVFPGLPHKGRSFVYFAALGFGFIFFEITLIQRLTLFLGYPTYSLTVTLASILVFTGVGALLSGRFADRPRQLLRGLLVTIVGLTAFYAFVLPHLTEAWLVWPFAARVIVAFAVLAPLGLCLGMFMPLGLGAVARTTDHPREYVAWGWAVNGFASVVGSVLTTILAMSFGFSTVLVVAMVIYLVALATLRSLLADAPVPGAAPEAPEPAAISATPS